MNQKQIVNLIRQGEGMEVEFKRSKDSLNKDTFDSVAAFLNRFGGHLFLGVADDGTIVGVSNPQKLIDEFVAQSNNPKKLSPTYYFSPQKMLLEGKQIVYIRIPQSSSVHRTRDRILDRNQDGDFDITDNHTLVSQMYLRKQSTYSENTIFEAVTIDDFDASLINRARMRAVRNSSGSHPWFDMSDEELMKSAQLFKRDLHTGKDGYNLAAILLLGKDDTILNALPYHRTDAILRIRNLDRYDDRDDIRTNLIDSFDRLMQFCREHLPDPFFEEGGIRRSLRDIIFREAISNTLIHREYTNPYPAKLIIKSDRVVIENANKAHQNDFIDLSEFRPYPKNPIIAKFFKEIGLADELGSGFRNISKYATIYAPNHPPKVSDRDLFRISLSYIPEDTPQDNTLINRDMQDSGSSTPQATPQATPKATPKADDELKRQILEFCTEPRSISELVEHFNYRDKKHFKEHYMQPLLQEGLLHMTQPNKPTSPNQQYIYKGENNG